MALVHRLPAFLGGPAHGEGGEEGVQQAGVVVVAAVLHVQLPVPVHALTLIAEHSYGLVEDPGDLLANLGAQIVFELLRVRRQRAEDHSVEDADSKAFQAVVGKLEVGRQTALTADAVPERHARQLSIQREAPAVVNASVVFRVASGFAPDQRATMGASVHECMDDTASVAAHEDGNVAHIGCFEIARIGKLGIERQA